MALLVQGPASGFDSWLALQRGLTNQKVLLLYLAFDTEVPGYGRTAGGESWTRAFHAANTTWTSGRNALARAALQQEASVGFKFKYWAFFDSDVDHLACAACTHIPVQQPAHSACCLDVYVSYLASPQQWASVAFYNPSALPGQVQGVMSQVAPLNILQVDCSDAKGQAFHREAIPALLPYIDSLDADSWHASQALLFCFQASCLKGYNVLLSGFAIQAVGESHSSYPRGRDMEKEAQALASDLEPYGVFPATISYASYGQGDCGRIRGQWTSSYTVEESARWKAAYPFLLCRQLLHRRFVRLHSDAAK